VIFRQFLDDDLGCASYLIGDENEHEAIVVDPPYAVEPLVAALSKHDLELAYVLETHNHADHVSGHGRLALDCGATVAIHELAGVAYPHQPLRDGEEVVVGSLRVRVVHTPGHRPEHCAFVVIDESRSPDPWLVLTGDSLFVGDAARPDLAVDAEEGAEGLFESLRKITALGDGVEVFPGHVAGSLCGASLSSKPSSTIGFERMSNHALATADVRAFTAELTSSLPPRPPNMERIVELNRGPFVGAPAPLPRLDAVPADGLVLDVRPAEAFATGHVANALNVPAGAGSFATRAGFVLPLDRPLALYGDAREVDAAARGLRSIGFIDLMGFLVEAETTERLEPFSLAEARAKFAAGEIDVLDVREDDERSQHRIDGSVHIPFSRIRDASVDGKPVATICESGARAAIAASVLAAKGADVHPIVDGGVSSF
jgi:glyoxylase-like metal-dependent hydrolase (beta-lactamase superfamily II)/rhodanese-related sulfurtransferase